MIPENLIETPTQPVFVIKSRILKDCLKLRMISKAALYYVRKSSKVLNIICDFCKLFLRLNFSSSIEAEKDQETHRKLRDQAYWLLENLIPGHVLKVRYC